MVDNNYRIIMMMIICTLRASKGLDKFKYGFEWQNSNMIDVRLIIVIPHFTIRNTMELSYNQDT